MSEKTNKNTGSSLRLEVFPKIIVLEKKYKANNLRLVIVLANNFVSDAIMAKEPAWAILSHK